MNVRITPTNDGERTVLQVAGRLESNALSELEKEIPLVDGPFVLDLSELTSADHGGTERLRELGAGRFSSAIQIAELKRFADVVGNL